MKKAVNILSLFMVIVMIAGVFAGCESQAEKLEKLAGTWIMTTDDTEEQAQVLLEGLDLYEEEIALVDLTALDYVKVVEFGMDKTYRFSCDPDGTKACVHTFLEGVFDTLYENRTALNDVYDVEFDEISKTDFLQFYADLYQQTDFDALIDHMVSNAYDYDSLADSFEVGTFSISGSKIKTTINGKSTAEAVGYRINGDQLTLTYSDAVEVYTRSN